MHALKSDKIKSDIDSYYYHGYHSTKLEDIAVITRPETF